ncbi:hypothetical protein GYMLUDRAFT_253207 [Collybiopsis luxurians FD-317 M1]|uniref:Uncharacterized protein n=1 Tax=Collybiopsis luxurians FD-317 M1 TaxID=944289 RepID=A0A0D0B7T3_9AGAR|nr:hypothetical protein GYMLUDRAFT_253207 [Collybiopsis luxurians FD-317 M1]
MKYQKQLNIPESTFWIDEADLIMEQPQEEEVKDISLILAQELRKVKEGSAQEISKLNEHTQTLEKQLDELKAIHASCPQKNFHWHYQEVPNTKKEAFTKGLVSRSKAVETMTIQATRVKLHQEMPIQGRASKDSCVADVAEKIPSPKEGCEMNPLCLTASPLEHPLLYSPNA